MSDIRLRARTWWALAAIVILCVVTLARMGNPEPALPRCASSTTDQIVRCEP